MKQGKQMAHVTLIRRHGIAGRKMGQPWRSGPRPVLVELKIKLPVTFFKEGETYIAYSPLLDLSSCGATLEEADQRFGQAATLFFEELEEMGTTEEVLKGLGWRKVQRPRPHWEPPPIIKQIQREVAIPIAA
ncbi:MAG: hypothetical protein HYZ73_07545 [Elusimicrobia bacterium]|nr:hypothetical protein [Elusimicrobiota bacterium]